MKSENRYVLLDGFRGIAAVLVMFHHFCLLNGVDFLESAYVAVDLFFILGGFVFSASAKNFLRGEQCYFDYAVARLTRFWPLPFLGCLIGGAFYFTQLYIDPTFIGTQRDTLMATFLNCFFIPYITAEPSLNWRWVSLFPVNNPAWFLYFYTLAILFMLPFLKLDKRTLWRLTVSFFLIFFALGVIYTFTTHRERIADLSMGWGLNNFMGGYFRMLFGFTLGILMKRLLDEGDVARFFERHPFIQKLNRWIVASPFILYVLVALMLMVPIDPLWGLYPILMLLLFPIVLISAATYCNPSHFSVRLSQALAWISFPLFSIHMPLSWWVDWQGASQCRIVFSIHMPLSWWVDWAYKKYPDFILFSTVNVYVGMATVCFTGAIVVGLLFDKPLQKLCYVVLNFFARGWRYRVTKA